MARGTTVTNLLTMLKAEIGDFASTNTSRDNELTVLLSNMQKRLATEHYWPFLERHWDVNCPAGQQYISLPTVTSGDPETETSDINLDELPVAKVLWNTLYQPVEYGINEEQYNIFNFALGQTSDPIQRWRLATNPNEAEDPNQFEVWPVPVTDQVMRFTGERAIQSLAAPTDTADLDDMLIVLFVAAERLARGEKADSNIKMQMAQRRLQWLKQGYTPKRVRRMLDGNSVPPRKDIKLIGVAASGTVTNNSGPDIGVG